MKILKDPRLWGASAFALLAILGMVAAMIYVSPPGDKVVSFYTEDASSITPESPSASPASRSARSRTSSIEPEQVRVRATVKGDAFVGDQSTVAVRMLTVVGGYYVNIDSLGDTALGDHAITRERVTLPYSLIRALTDTTKITQGVPDRSGQPSAEPGTAGVDRPEPRVASRRSSHAGSKLTETLDRQSGQLSAILTCPMNTSTAWPTTAANFRSWSARSPSWSRRWCCTARACPRPWWAWATSSQGLGPVGELYLNHRDKFLARFIHGQQTIRAWADRSGLIVRILRRTRDRMEATLDVQHAPPELLATDLCIPLPESPC